LLTLSFALLIPAMTACDDKEAEELAGQLTKVAKSYQEQILRTTKAEQKAYEKLAALYVQSARNDMTKTLEVERAERSGRFADQATYGSDAPPLLSDIHSQLRDYAELDFKNMQLLLKDESEARAEYLAQLEKLNVDTKKIGALAKSFESLSKRQQSPKQAKEIIGFWQETKTEVDKQYCRDSARDIKTIEAGIKALEESVKEQQSAPASETSEEAADRQTRLAALNSDLAALKSELELLNGQQAAKKCDQLLAAK
jgi:hypothetical protein